MFREYFSDYASADSAPRQRCQRLVFKFRRDGGEQTARSLRVEQQGAKIIGHIRCEIHAAFDEIAVVLHPARKETAAGRFDGAGKIFHTPVIDLHGNTAADSHFASVAEERETGHVRDRVNRRPLPRPSIFDFMQCFRGAAIEASH